MDAVRVLDDVTQLAATGFVSGDVPSWNGTLFAPLPMATNYLKLDASNGPLTGKLGVSLITSPLSLTELIANGTFNTDLSSWTLVGDTTWSASYGGSVRLIAVGYYGASNAKQFVPCIAGRYYRFSIQVHSTTGGCFAELKQSGGSTKYITPFSPGTYTIDYYCSVATNIEVTIGTSSGSTSYLDNVSLRIYDVAAGDFPLHLIASNVVSELNQNSTIEIGRLDRNASVAAQAGFGVHWLTRLKSSTTADTEATKMKMYWRTATHASREGAFAFGTFYGSAITDFFYLSSGNVGIRNNAPAYPLDLSHTSVGSSGNSSYYDPLPTTTNTVANLQLTSSITGGPHYKSMFHWKVNITGNYGSTDTTGLVQSFISLYVVNTSAARLKYVTLLLMSYTISVDMVDAVSINANRNVIFPQYNIPAGSTMTSLSGQAWANPYSGKTQSWTSITGVSAAAGCYGYSSGAVNNITDMYAAYLQSASATTGSVGTNNVTNMYGVWSYNTVQGRVQNVVQNMFGAYFKMELLAGPVLVNMYGVYVDMIGEATTLTYAYYSNQGNVLFNASGHANADFTVRSDTYDALFVDAGNDSIDIMHHASGKIGFFAGTPITQQTLNAYSSDPESTPYTGALDGEAQLADLNALRVAYETLRASYDDLRAKLVATTLVLSA